MYATRVAQTSLGLDSPFSSFNNVLLNVTVLQNILCFLKSNKSLNSSLLRPLTPSKINTPPLVRIYQHSKENEVG